MARKVRCLVEILTFLLGLFSLASCKDTSEEEAGVVSETKEVVVVFEHDALGDDSYNDMIYKGLLKYIKEKPSNVKVNYYNPSSREAAEKIVKAWKNDTLSNNQQLLVLAGSSYKDLVVGEFEDSPLETKKKNILLFESDEVDIDGVSSFKFCMYGVSYIVGAMIGQYGFTPVVIKGCSTDTVTDCYVDGFRNGYFDYNNSDSFIYGEMSLSDSFDGYYMEDSVYVLMYEWTKICNFVFPVVGGSVAGVYRYLREYPVACVTVGIDVDQSDYCEMLIGNIIKSVDVVLVSYLKEWAAEGTLTKSATFDMRSGYTYWKSDLNANDVIDGIESIAMEKEEEYENSH